MNDALVLNKTPLVTFGYIIQVAISLAIVLGLIFLISKYILPKLTVTPKGRLLEVLDRIGIEPQVSVHVVKLGKNIYVLCASNKNVSVVDKLKEGEER